MSATFLAAVRARSSEVRLDATSNQTSAILSAIAAGKSAELRELLRTTEAIPHAVNGCVNGRVPLLVAAGNDRVDLVRSLLLARAEPDIAGAQGKTALCIAAAAGDADTVGTLLKAKAAVDLAMSNGATALACACAGGARAYSRGSSHLDCCRVLLEHSANANARKSNGATPLYMACQNAEGLALPMAKMLIHNGGAEVNALGPKGASPLYIACAEGHATLAALLLSHRASPTEPADGGRTPLAVVVEERGPHAEALCNLLLDARSDPNAAKHNGITPLFLACATLDRAGRLDGHTREAWKRQKARDAALCRDADGLSGLVDLLLASKADVEAADSGDVRPLWIAAHQGNADAVTRLLDARAGINEVALDETTALWAACSQGNYHCARVLVECRADLTLPSRLTPLAVAKWHLANERRRPGGGGRGHDGVGEADDPAQSEQTSRRSYHQVVELLQNALTNSLAMGLAHSCVLP